MEHECFERDDVAAVLNEQFVSVKVDREERPDIDQIYMRAVQAMTGQGGWPMTVFLTPQGEPFYGGTYFPPVERHGMPSFKRLLLAINDAYRNKRDSITNTTHQLREVFESGGQLGGAAGELSRPLLDRAARALARDFDEEHAGFGDAPKFPPSMSLDPAAALGASGPSSRRYQARSAPWPGAAFTTSRRRDPSLFRRRAVARPALRRCCTTTPSSPGSAHLWQATGEPDARRVTQQLCPLAREMTSPEGASIRRSMPTARDTRGRSTPGTRTRCGAIARDAEVLLEYWGNHARRQLRGRNILHLAADPSVVARRHVLAHQLASMSARARHCTPSARGALPADDKVIASWNGLMLRAVAEVRASSAIDLRTLALRNGEFSASTWCGGRVSRS
jgi:uncharacterized protein YyaL (SSP411 family)